MRALATALLLTCLAWPALGQNCTEPCDRCFVGTVSDSWTTGGNWVDRTGGPGVPTGSDLACFRNLEESPTTTCTGQSFVVSASATAEALRLECGSLSVTGGTLNTDIEGSSGRSVTQTGGTVAGAVSLTGGNARYNLRGGTLSASLTLAGGSDLHFSGSGTRVFSPSAAFNTDGTLVFDAAGGTTTIDANTDVGDVEWDSATPITVDGADFEIDGDITFSEAVNIVGENGATLTLNQGHTFSTALTATDIDIVNAGHNFRFTSTVDLQGTAGYVQSGAGALTRLNSGQDFTCASGSVSVGGGEFYAQGTLGCSVSVNPGSVLSTQEYAPGEDELTSIVASALNVGGDFTASAGSTIMLSVDSSGTPSKIVASGNVALGGSSVSVRFYSTPSRSPEPFQLVQTPATLTGEWSEPEVVGHNPGFHCPKFDYSASSVELDIDCNGVNPDRLTVVEGIMLAGIVLAVGGAIGGAVMIYARRGSQRSGRTRSGRGGGGGGAKKSGHTNNKGHTQQTYAKGAPKAEKKPEKFRPGRKVSTGKERKEKKGGDMGDMIASTMDAQPSASRFDKQRKNDWAKKDVSSGKRSDSGGKRDRKDKKKKDKDDKEAPRDMKGMSVATKVFNPTDSQLNLLWQDNVTPEDKTGPPMRKTSNGEKGGRRRGSSGAKEKRGRSNSKQKPKKKDEGKTLSAITIAPPGFG